MHGKKVLCGKDRTNTGELYGTWADCKAQVDGYSGAVYKSFPTAAEALAFVTGETKQVEDPAWLPCIWQLSQRTGEFSFMVLRDSRMGKNSVFRRVKRSVAFVAMHNVAGGDHGVQMCDAIRSCRGAVRDRSCTTMRGLQNGVWANGKLAKKGHRLIKHFMIVSSPRYM